MAKVGVIGGSGFIGGWVTAGLIESGHEAIVFDRRKAQAPINDLASEVWLGDATDKANVADLARSTDGLIDLAATVEVIGFGDPTSRVLANVLSGMNFLEALRCYNKPGIYMGDPRSTSKEMIGHLCEVYRDSHSTKVNVVTATEVYGAHQPGPDEGGFPSLVPRLVSQMLSGEDLTVVDESVDLTYAGDLAMALVGAWEATAERKTFPDPVNPGATYAMIDLAEAVVEAGEALGYSRVEIHAVPAETEMCLDSETSGSLEVLKEGILRTVEWFEANSASRSE